MKMASLFYSSNEKELIASKMQNSEKFIISKKYENKYISIYFLPIQDIQGDKNVAYLVLYKHSDYIEQVKYNYFKMNFILFLISLFFIFYMKYKYKHLND